MSKKLNTLIEKEIERIIAKCGNTLDVTEVLTMPILQMLPISAIDGWDEHSYPSGKEFVRLVTGSMNEEAKTKLHEELKAIDDDFISHRIDEEEKLRIMAKQNRKQRMREEEENSLHVAKYNMNIRTALELWEKLLDTRLKNHRHEVTTITADDTDEQVKIKLQANLGLIRSLMTVSEEVFETLNTIDTLITTKGTKLSRVPEHSPSFVGAVTLQSMETYWDVICNAEMTFAANSVSVVSLDVHLSTSSPLALFNYTQSNLESVTVELISKRGLGYLLITNGKSVPQKVPANFTLVRIKNT